MRQIQNCSARGSRAPRGVIFIFLALLNLPLAAAANQVPDPELRRLLVKAVEASDSFADRFEAEVWLTDMSTRLAPIVDNAAHRIYLLRHIHYEARRAKLEPELVLAVIEVESYFDRWALSRVGARGLMQVMPFWLKEIGHPDDDLFHIRTNLRMGCTILRYYLDKEKGDLVRALRRYNGSLKTSRYSNKVLKALSRRWFKR